MIGSYLKIALRNLARHRSFTATSLFGLVTGLTSALALTIFAYQELTYDGHHSLRDQLYLVYKERATPSGTQLVYDTWVPMLEALRSDYGDIESGTRLLRQQASVAIGEQRFSEEISFADPELLTLFDLPLQNGSGERLLQAPSNVILSEETAFRFFGGADPNGKQLQVVVGGQQFDFVVAGVLKSIPSNSSIRPSMLVSFANALRIEQVARAEWRSSFLLTFVKVQTPDVASRLEMEFPGLVRKYFGEETASQMNVRLLPLSDYHHQMTNSHTTAIVMLIIASIITLIAVVNYINLSTVRSIERAREIGVRKVLGASRFGLAKQFLGESMLLTAMAFIMSIVILQVAAPFIRQTLDMSLRIDLFSGSLLPWIVMLAFLIVGISSGAFPALFISRFRTVESIKGKLKSSSVGLGVKRGLLIFQFSLSTILLFGTLVVHRQVSFMRHHDLGFSKTNVLVVPTDTDNMMDPAGARSRLSALRSELLKHSQVEQVSSSTIVPSDLSQAGYTFVRPEGWLEEQPFRIMRVSVDEAYFPLYDIRILEGENFREGFVPVDTAVRNFAIVNEAALRVFGWKEVVGKKIGTRTQVVGLAADHHYNNLALPVEPMIFLYRPMENQANSFVSIRINGEPSEVVSMIGQQWRTLDASRPFSYFFVDSNFDNLYRSDVRNFRIVTWFSGLAIVITCLGLFSLISFTITQRIKEIGIRKILGSTVFNIIVLLNREFIVLLIASFVISVPVAYVIMSQWLTNFAVQTTIPLLVPLVVVCLTVLLVLITTSLRIWRAAVANPVDSIRLE